jgi:hypothetical protein
MPAMRCVFFTTPAFLGRIDGETRCAFWADDPTEHGFDPARLIAIDLARSPDAAAAGELAWAEVEVDAAHSGPNGRVVGTTLGTVWPELAVSGVVGIEARFRAALPEAVRPVSPPDGATGRGYEYMSVLYWPSCSDARAARRYTGHHARIVEELGRLARVEICAPGSSLSANPVRHSMWIDLSSAEQCDAGPDALTEIGVGEAPKEGALFLLSGRLSP